MLVSQLEDQHLDYHVARADGYTLPEVYPGAEKLERRGILIAHYSTEWMYGGPVIEREHINVYTGMYPETGWYALKHGEGNKTMRGNSPLVAAMRIYVSSKFGEEVE